MPAGADPICAARLFATLELSRGCLQKDTSHPGEAERY